ncbi:MAG: adenosylcobalamin-dependent ribonucleoside-diphosphate reductase [Anaerolineales bacterium]|nr:MAG: adenosylcobalamin-dependent ribonucleoside-diphosphate reductase [Anaerolineales bacterium]
MLETDRRDVDVDVSGGLGSTPPVPTDLPAIELSENARTILVKRYLRRGGDGEPIETIEAMFWRVAYHVAAVEVQWEQDVETVAIEFYKLLTDKRFFPNSPTFTGAGTPLGQLAACFVLPINDDMGRDSAGIFQTLRDAALIQQTGGGNGFSFSRLRPSGDHVKSSAGQATGPVGFLRVYDQAFGEIAQGGTRRGANMAVLRVDHPDIEQFIKCKTDEHAITNFNISVGITDSFMRAVEEDDWWELTFPDVSSDSYRKFKGVPRDGNSDIPKKVFKRVRARELFNKIIEQAHHNGEPGLLFLDAANRSNPVPHLYDLEATNPCGEQWLGPYENCCLGSINLAQHFGQGKSVDWDTLRKSVALATRFLDDVVSANAYVPAVPQLKEAALRARRIGLGIMGLGDLMYHVGVRYGSDEAQEFAAQVMEFVRYHCMLTSVELARERGPFPAIEGSIYDPDDLTWEVPKPLFPHTREFGRSTIDWNQVSVGIQQYGIRNAAQTTVAPTGTIATVAGCEAYGCEPAFALAYFRHVDDGGTDLRLTYTSPLFERSLIAAGVDELTREMIVEAVMKYGSCQDIEAVPDQIRDVFVVSHDISAEEHVRMQAALQAFVDNSLSKTCNFPADAGVEQVAQAYQLAWQLGCKGLTVYVTGSRQKVVLETRNTIEQNELQKTTPKQIQLWLEGKKPRPQRLDGCTYQITTPLGKAFVTVNENGAGAQQPFEVFITSAKAGSETAAVSEAIGRLISYLLRVASPVPPRDRLGEVVRQLAGIGGGRPTGFGPNRVLSLPDGLARSLAAYLEETPEVLSAALVSEEAIDEPIAMRIGDLCPECGAATVVKEEGCSKCYGCGFSEC